MAKNFEKKIELYLVFSLVCMFIIKKVDIIYLREMNKRYSAAKCYIFAEFEDLYTDLNEIV